MTLEKTYRFSEKGESHEAVVNMAQLTEDFPSVVIPDKNGFYINPRDLFIGEDRDETYISYCSHEESLNNVLMFSLRDYFEDDLIEKELYFNTILDISRDDGRNEITIKDCLTLSLMKDSTGSVRLYLRPVGTDLDQAISYPLKSGDSGEELSFSCMTRGQLGEENPLRRMIRETLNYYIDNFSVSYNSNGSRLSIAMGLE
jgi:hypothetical protein